MEWNGIQFNGICRTKQFLAIFFIFWTNNPVVSVLEEKRLTANFATVLLDVHWAAQPRLQTSTSHSINTFVVSGNLKACAKIKTPRIV